MLPVVRIAKNPPYVLSEPVLPMHVNASEKSSSTAYAPLPFPVLFDTVFDGEKTIWNPSYVLRFIVARSIVLPLELSQKVKPLRRLREPSSPVSRFPFEKRSWNPSETLPLAALPSSTLSFALKR